LKPRKKSDQTLRKQQQDSLRPALSLLARCTLRSRHQNAAVVRLRPSASYNEDRKEWEHDKYEGAVSIGSSVFVRNLVKTEMIDFMFFILQPRITRVNDLKSIFESSGFEVAGVKVSRKICQ
jgi:hypothetical protein